MDKVEKMARELLAAEYEVGGLTYLAEALRENRNISATTCALRALAAALRQQQDGVQCCMCVKRVDTRENGTPGAELTDGRWACSEECWERATASTAGREAVACYGIRRKGTQAIIGVVPEKVHAIPLDPERSAPYMRDYEEVPLYTHPSPAIGSELEAIKREWHAAKLKHPLGEEERVRNSMIDDFLGDLDRILPSTGSGDERNTPREAGSA